MIEIKIIDKSKYGFKWNNTSGCYVSGYAYVNGCYLEGEELLQYFLETTDENAFINKVKRLNGIFAVILAKSDILMAAVDRYGVFKLFYHQNGNKLIIGNNTGAIVKSAGLKDINKDAEKDWLYAGFSAKNETLFNGVFSLNASKALFFDSDNSKLRVENYHEFLLKPSEKPYSDLYEQLGEVFNKSSKRFISSLNGKKVLIPLSGGVDSRFGALMLYKAGYKNVLCFTYGNKNSKEGRIAYETSNIYGFEHIFIPYRARDWRRLFKDKKNLDYIEFASQYKAVPHFSDLFAAEYISKNFDKDECIIVPGHVGSIAEGILDNGEYFASERLTRLLIKKYFYFYGEKCDGSTGYLKDRLSGYFGNELPVNAEKAHDLFDSAAYDTYRSNHLFMALKPYEFYGFQWRLPLMDAEIVEFFEEVSLDYKTKKKILLSDFVALAYKNDPGYFKEPKSFWGKVSRNLFDKRYCCINPFDVFKLRKKEYGLPRINRVLYRYYRNYLSYVSAKTLWCILSEKIYEKN
ncbi:MAG: hypothetical protein KAH14_04090 [Clostridiales bacterium]|nr:hypothetical protein [Clostridiales bacterium]